MVLESSANAQRPQLEQIVLAAIGSLWPDANELLGTETLLAYLAERDSDVAPRALYLLLENLQMRGSVRLSRGNPLNASAEAHGARTIRWVNPALFA